MIGNGVKCTCERHLIFPALAGIQRKRQSRVRSAFAAAFALDAGPRRQSGKLERMKPMHFTLDIGPATLTGVQLEDITYDQTTIWPTGFDPATIAR